MITFKRLIKIVGYLTATFLFLILAIIFFGLVTKESILDFKVVKIESKADAKSINIWRISKDGLKKYRLVASSMVKTKNDLVILNNAELWYFEKNKPDIYLRADKAIVDASNNVNAFGNVYLKRSDLNIYAKEINWLSKKKILKSKKVFRGFSSKSSFFGKNFIYYMQSNKLLAFGVDIWLK
jgi:LPS export ABC transporter protein LptC